jgi:hypothetical protein
MEKVKISRKEKVDLYKKMVDSCPDAVLKGDTIPYTSLNGHMYSYLSKDDTVALRLPDEDRAKFIDKYKTKLMEQYGVIQKEYVAVPDGLLRKTAELKKYFAISFNYVSSLKPKATSKKKN